MVSTTGLFHLALPPYIASSQERARDRCRTQDLCFLCFRCLCRSSFPNNRSVTSKTKPPERAWLCPSHKVPEKTLDWLWEQTKKQPSSSFTPPARRTSARARQTSRRRSDSRTVCERCSSSRRWRVNPSSSSESMSSSKRQSTQNRRKGTRNPKATLRRRWFDRCQRLPKAIRSLVRARRRLSSARATKTKTQTSARLWKVRETLWRRRRPQRRRKSPKSRQTHSRDEERAFVRSKVCIYRSTRRLCAIEFNHNN